MNYAHENRELHGIDVVDTAAAGEVAVANSTGDTVAPVIESVTTNVFPVKTFTPIQFSIVASDDVKVTRYQLTVNGTNVYVNAVTGKSNSYTFTEAGTYPVVAKAYDAAGNVGTYEMTVDVSEIPDVLAPEVYISSPSNGKSYSGDVRVQIRISDRDSLEVDWTATLINNDTGETTVLASGERTFTATTIATLQMAEYAEGSYTLKVSAVDKGGNITEKTSDFSIDRTPPTVTINSTNRLEANQIIYFQVTAEDASAIGSKSLLVNNTGVALDANGSGSYVFAAPGEFTLVATATDAAGNRGSVTRVITVTENTDHAGPTITIHSPVADAYIGGSTNIVASIDDSDSDWIGNWSVKLYSEAGPAYNLGNGSGKVDYGVLKTFHGASYPEGPLTILVEAQDPAGNIGRAEQPIIIAKKPPTARLNYPEPDFGNWMHGPKQITGVITPGSVPIAGVSWKVFAMNVDSRERILVSEGAGQPEDGVFAVFSPAASGSYSITMELVDLAGNTSTASPHSNLRFDLAAPHCFSIESRIEAKYIVRVYIDALDDMGGEIMFKATPKQTGPMGAAVGWCNTWGGIGDFTRAPNGVYEFTITIDDLHGHEVEVGEIRIEKTSSGLNAIVSR